MEIVSKPPVPVQAGQPFQFYVRINNTGVTEARNIKAYIQLPQEFRGQHIGGEPSAEGKLNGWVAGIHEVQHIAELQVPMLAAGRTAEFQLEYPSIDQRGHTITCTVFADGQRITQESRRLEP